MLRFGGMMEQSSEEFVQLMISLLIKGSQIDSYVGARKSNALGRGCLTSYKLEGD